MKLPRALYDEIKRHALDSVPCECVGLVASRAGRPYRVFPLVNVADEPVKEYRVAIAEQIAALETIDRAGLRLFAVYHSHPRAAPSPSLRDIEQALPGVHIIVGMSAGLVTRAFSIVGHPTKQVRPVPLEIC